jgi:predicted GIY-YIG superfamily endonuclease
MIGIYKITNKINGKAYIGQSNHIKRRWSEHKRNIGSNKNPMYLAF